MTAIVGATLQLNKLAVLDGAGREFAQTSYGSKTAFLVPYALFKAACNLLVGGLADRHGRKSIALAGSLVGLVPPVMVLAASGAGDGKGWPAFVGSAAFLGVHQGVTWTCCVLITMDLCGPNARGLASGLSETVGYTFIAVFAEAYGALERGSVTCAWDQTDVPTSECLEASRAKCDTPDDWVAECTGQCVCVGYAVAPFALQLALAAVGVGVAAAVLRESRQAPSRAAADSDNATELSARVPRDDRSSFLDARKLLAAAKTGAFVELEALEADDDALLERDASGEMSAEKENDVSFEASGETRDLSFRAERLSVSFARATWGNRALAVVCVAGFCANFETGMAWGLLASWSRDGLGIGGARRDAFMASYSFLKGFSQLAAGIFSDRVGRRWPMSVGLLGGAASLLLAAFGAGYDGAYLSHETRGDTEEHALDARFANLMASGVLLGLFTGLMYPVLAAAAADHAPGGALAGTVGTVRFWRDLGYAMGMPVAAIADASRPETALIFVACVMAAAGALVAVAYVEKHPHRA